MNKFASLLVLSLFLALPLSGVSADQEMITWCHCEPNGNCQTLTLPKPALIGGGHVDASGNPLHGGDHLGQCVEPTPTPTPVKPPEVPEFGLVTGLAALVTSAGAYGLLKKRSN